MAVLLISACATTGRGDKEMVARGMPLLERLLGAPLAEVPEMESTGLHACRADLALFQGRHNDAFVELTKAVEVLPESAPACRTRGALLYLQGLVAGMDKGSRSEEGWDRLREVCVDAEVGAAEADARTYFSYLAAKEEKPEDSVDDQTSEAARWAPQLSQTRRQWIAQMARDGGKLDGTRSEVLAAFAHWLRTLDEKPADVCDHGFRTRHLQALEAAYLKLEELGRPDLALSWWTMPLTDDEGMLNPQALAAFRSWAEDPANRWIRTDSVAQALATLRFQAEWVDPVLTIPLCDLLLADVRGAMDADRREGFNYRNVQRLMDAFHASGSCLYHDSLVALMDQALEASMAGESGKAGIIEAIGGVAVNLLIELVDGRSDMIGLVVPELVAGAARMRGGLGESDEDRAVEALLGVVVGAGTLMQGDFSAIFVALEKAVATFDELAQKPRAGDEPAILQVAPGIRSGILLVMAVIRFTTGTPHEGHLLLARLDQNLEQDLSSLLKYLEQPDHSQALMALVRGGQELVSAIEQKDGTTLDEVFPDLVTAAAPRPGETGWWAIGLNTLRFVVLDIFAVIAYDREVKALAEKALAEAEDLSSRVVEGFLTELDVPETMATLLRLLPPLHRAIPQLASDREELELVLEVARALDEPLKGIVDRIRQSGDTRGARPAAVADLITDLLETAADVGLEKLIQEEEKALLRVVEVIEKKLPEYPPDIRVFMQLVVAATRFFDDPAQAHEVFVKARTDASRHLPTLNYVPQLAEASLLVSRKDDLEGALAAVDQALALGDVALDCGSAHPVHSVLPFRVWAREVRGDHEGARRDLELFSRLVDEGFAGDSPLSCVLQSHSENFSFTVTLASSTGGIMLPGKQDGTFQVGLGSTWGSDESRHGDELVCDAVTLQSPRLDRIMEAYLAWAAYSLMRHEDREAHRALMAAVAVGRQLYHGNVTTLGRRRAAMLDESRKKLSLPMVAWTSLLARLRGQTQVADILDQIGIAVGPLQEKGWFDCLPEDDAPPVLLKGFEQLDGFGPLVRQWISAANRPQVDEVKKKMAAWARKKKFVEPWGLELAADVLETRLEARVGKSARAAEIKPPRKNARGAALVGLRNMLAAAGSSNQTPAVDLFETTMRALAEQGLYGEMAGPASRLAMHAHYQGNIGLAMAMAETAAKYVTAGKAPFFHADLLSLQADLLRNANQVRKAFNLLLEVIPVLTGRVAVQTEVTQRWTVLQMVGAFGDYGVLKVQLASLLPMVARAYGATSSQYYTLVAVDIALRLQNQDLDSQVFQALAVHGGRVRDAADTPDFFKLLLQTKTHDERRQLGLDFLAFVLQGGPKPVLKKDGEKDQSK